MMIGVEKSAEAFFHDTVPEISTIDSKKYAASLIRTIRERNKFYHGVHVLREKRMLQLPDCFLFVSTKQGYNML